MAPGESRLDGEGGSSRTRTSARPTDVGRRLKTNSGVGPPTARQRAGLDGRHPFNWPRLRWPAWAWRKASPWARRMSASSSAGRGTAAAAGRRRFTGAVVIGRSWGWSPELQTGRASHPPPRFIPGAAAAQSCRRSGLVRWRPPAGRGDCARPTSSASVAIGRRRTGRLGGERRIRRIEGSPRCSRVTESVGSSAGLA